MKTKATGGVIGKVVATKRAGTSVMGNPSYDVTLEEPDGHRHTYRTSSDSGLSYGIQNSNYRDEWHRYGLTRAGRLDGYATRVDVDGNEVSK